MGADRITIKSRDQRERSISRSHTAGRTSVAENKLCEGLFQFLALLGIFGRLQAFAEVEESLPLLLFDSQSGLNKLGQNATGARLALLSKGSHFLCSG